LNSTKDYASVLASKETVDLDLNLISIFVDAFVIKMSAVYQIGHLIIILAGVSVANKIANLLLSGIAKIVAARVLINIVNFPKYSMKKFAIVRVL
jgi:hypothetical protein